MRIIRTLSPFVAALTLSLLVCSCSDSPTGADNDGGDNDDDGQQTSYSRTDRPGTSANDFLSDENFTRLVVEIDYIGDGYKPTPDAIESLETFLEERLHKTSVTVMDPTQISTDSDRDYTIDEIAELENEHRDTQTEDNKLSAYMLITNGRYHDRDGNQTNVLGIAYYNTSTAFFGEGYDEASGGLGQASRYEIEATSFRHEFGHLFGLVGIEASGTEMQQDHKDPNPEHGNHCNDDTCLMYYAMETSDLFSGAFGGNIPPLDQNCINDLQANGGK